LESGPGLRGLFYVLYLDHTFDGDIDVEERIGALQKLQNGVVMMHLIAVRTTFETAAKTGLYGPLGDACIQLVSVSDEARLNAFLDFAEKCESKADRFIAKKQAFHRESPESMTRRLNHKLGETFGAEAGQKLPPLSPGNHIQILPPMVHPFIPSEVHEGPKMLPMRMLDDLEITRYYFNQIGCNRERQRG
jgi:hypothetical protein